MKPDVTRNDILCLLAIIGAGLLVYSNHLHHPFQFDSVRYLTENRLFDNPDALLTWDYFWSQYHSRGGLFWSLGLNAQIHGMAPLGFHLVNLAFHLMNAILIFFISRLAIRYFRFETLSGSEQSVGLSVALLFVAHPIHTESVVYVMSRSELAAGWCYLMAFYLFQRALDSRTNSSALYKYGAAPLVTLVALVVGYSIKPTIATLPAMMLLYFLLGRDRQDPVWMRLRRWAWPIVGLCLVAGSALAYKLATQPLFLSGSPAAAELIGRKVYLLTQPTVVMFYYLKLLCFPFNLNIDPDIVWVKSIADIAFWLGMIAVAGFLLTASRIARSRLLLFFALWYLVVLTPSSSIVTLLDMAADHRAYLASFGILVLMATGLHHLGVMIFKNPVKRRSCIVCVLLFALTANGLLTLKRNTVWANELDLWQDALKKSPGKVRPLVNLGRAYTIAGDTERAIDYYERSLELNPNYFQTNYNVGVLYYEKGQIDKAFDHFQYAAVIDPTVPDVHGRLGDIYMQRKIWDKADAHLRQAVELNPYYSAAFRSLGLLHYFHLNDPRTGAVFLKRSLHLQPEQRDAGQLRQLISKIP